MRYLKFNFELSTQGDYRQDLLIDDLAGIGFDSFEDHDKGFNAFIPEKDFHQEALLQLKSACDKHFLIACTQELIDEINWNIEWERNFQPIIVDQQCYIRATFHESKKDVYPYELIIDPKMSFGTGHHQTTSGVIKLMLSIDFKDKTVLDMGCGTGILAILAQKLGAKRLTAIDFDTACVASTEENALLNQISELRIIHGGKEVIPENENYDIIIANINRNILLDQIESYHQHLQDNGFLFLSGFYFNADFEIIKNKCKQFQLTCISTHIEDDWTACLFQK